VRMEKMIQNTQSSVHNTSERDMHVKIISLITCTTLENLTDQVESLIEILESFYNFSFMDLHHSPRSKRALITLCEKMLRGGEYKRYFPFIVKLIEVER